MAFCTQCGNTLRDGAQFCDKCGQKTNAPRRCPQCKAELREGAQFCDNCGTALETFRLCPVCGKKNNSKMKFCQGCGASMTAQPAPKPAPAVIPAPKPAAVTPPAPKAEEVSAPAVEEMPAQPAAEEAVPEPPKQRSKKPFLFAGIAAAAVAVIAVIAVLLLVFGREKAPAYALYEKDGELYYTSLKSDGKTLNLSNKLEDSHFVHVSKNQKYLFLRIPTLDPLYETTNEDGGLYYLDLTDKNPSPWRIDKNFAKDMGFATSDDGNLVTYVAQEGDTYSLCRYNIKKEDRETIADINPSFTLQFSEDGKTVLFFDEDNHLCRNTVEKETVDLGETSAKLSYISEDMNTFYWFPGNYEDGYSIYKKVGAEEAQLIAEDVSLLRTSCSEEFHYISDSAVYYYDGEKSIHVLDIETKSCWGTCSGAGAATFLREEDGDFMVIRDKVIPVDLPEAEARFNFFFADDGSAGYYYDMKSDGTDPDLYRIPINLTKKTAGEAELYAEEAIFKGRAFFDGEPIYFKDYNENSRTFDLYLGKERLARDVSHYFLITGPDRLVYFTDNAMYIHDGKKAEKIVVDFTNQDDFYYCWNIAPDGSVLYLDDRESDGTYTLFCWRDGKEEQITRGVNKLYYTPELVLGF